MAAPTAGELGKFLGREVNADQAAEVIRAVTAQASAYTRGYGFTSGVPCDEIRSCILTCAARLISHPRQVGMDETRGPDSARWMASPISWSVSELLTLDRYAPQAL